MIRERRLDQAHLWVSSIKALEGFLHGLQLASQRRAEQPLVVRVAPPRLDVAQPKANTGFEDGEEQEQRLELITPSSGCLFERLDGGLRDERRRLDAGRSLAPQLAN
jgi:hypothetical protein